MSDIVQPTPEKQPGPRILVSAQPLWQPLLKLLARQTNCTFFAMHPEFAKSLRDLDLNAQPLGYGIDGHTLRAAAYSHAVRSLTELAKQKHLGPLHPQCRRYLEDTLPSYLYPRLGELATLVEAVDRTRPDLILLHNDVEPSTRAVALWAKAHHIPCLHIPHAVYIDGFGRGPIGTDVHDLVTASHIAVAGPYQDTWYSSRGGHTRLTGLPQFDKWATPRVPREQAHSLFGLSSDRPVVLYASSWRQDTNLLGCHDGVEESYLNFLQAMKQLPEVQVIVKTHPRASNLPWHVEQAKAAGVPCVVTPHHNEVAFQAADLVLSYGPSNFLIDAAHHDHLRLAAIHGFAEDSVVQTLTEKVDNLRDGIAQMLSEPVFDLKGFVYKYAGIPDGGATARIADYARALLAGGN